MDKRKRLLTAIAALTATVAFATTPNTSSQPKTFLGPTAHLGIVKTITDDSAFALAGEAGPKNLRLSGTAGWEFDFHQRIKATAEYLRQKLTYAFYDGNQDVWMGQAAIGGNYEYDFRQVDPFNTLLDLTAYYSHTPSKGLGVDSNVGGATLYKRVAGANSFGIGPGLSLVTLGGTKIGADLMYDNVHYDTKYRSALTVKGLGGTLKLSQAITDDVSIGGAASFRKPYNNYSGNITFGNIEYYGIWALSGFGDYTIGKSTMPSSYNVGLGADYFFDASNKAEPTVPQRPMPEHYKDYKGYKDYKDLPPLVWEEPTVADQDLLKWVAVPVVHEPIHGVPDQKLVCPAGAAPRYIGPANPANDAPFSTTGQIPAAFTAPFAPYFTGSSLHYSEVTTIDPLSVFGSPSDFSINANSGVLSYNVTGVQSTYNIIVTAENECGSASVSFTFSNE